MIVYVTTRKHADTLGVQLHYFPGKLAAAVRLVSYELLYTLAELPAATFIFTDFERITGEELARATCLADYLIGAGLPVLNHPGRAMFRFDLLRCLHDRGTNDFNAYRLAEWRSVRRFPAFIRRERDHKGPLTNLLPDMPSLSAAVAEFRDQDKSDQLIIVEFANAPYADGRFRKFGLQRIGNRIFHQHCYITHDWLGKGVPAELNATDIAEARDVLRRNPNVERMRPVFDLAGVDYGRMDYGIVGDRLQVFEINTNPTIISPPHLRHPNVDSQFFAAMHEQAMLPLASVSGQPLPLPPELAASGEKLTVDQAHARTLSAMLRRLKLEVTRRLVSRMTKKLLGVSPRQT
jgi:hypothetical protein